MGDNRKELLCGHFNLQTLMLYAELRMDQILFCVSTQDQPGNLKQ